MNNLNQDKFDDYTFIYDKSLERDFNDLGYHDKDLERLYQDLIAYLNNTPPLLKGDIIKESGGAVKVRLTKSNSTRGSEDRLIYTLLSHKHFVFMRIYNKSKKKDLSKKEIREIRKLVNQYSKSFAASNKFVGIGVVKGPVISDEDLSSRRAIFVESSFKFSNEIITLE